MKPRLMIQQKITAMVNKYRVFGVTETGEQGLLQALAQQKRLALKEKVLFYTDEKRDKLSFTFRADKVFDVHGRYFVEDANGKMLGMFKKEFVSSFVNSTWKVLDAEGNELYIVRESNQTLAVLRRFMGMIPIIGDLAEVVLAFIRYHFDFVTIDTNAVVGKYRKVTLFRDHYVLDADDSLWNGVDWRVLAALSVALDALQSR